MTDALATLTGPTMGTRFTVRAAVTPAAASRLTAQLQAVVDRVDQQMSTWRPDSTLGRFNRSLLGEWVGIEPEFAEVVRIGLEVGALTGGAFDMTLGELVDLWGFGPAGRVDRPPPSERIAAAMASSGHRCLELRDCALRRTSPLRLDLSGIAKGFGVDELARVLLANGVEDFIAEIDGEVRISGTRPDGSAWRVAIALPVPHLLAPYAALSPGTMAVASSGDYRRFFRSEGRHYSHTIDARTGAPVAEGIAAATVLDPFSCTRADAIASALMVMGWNGARLWCATNGIAAILLRRVGSEIEHWSADPISLDGPN